MRWNLEECSMKACCKGFDFLKIYKKDSRDHLRWPGVCASAFAFGRKRNMFELCQSIQHVFFLFERFFRSFRNLVFQ